MIRLEQLRIDAGLSPKQLAKVAGVAYQTVKNIEGGKSEAQVETLHKLAKALDAQPSELLMPAVYPPSRAAA